MQVSILLASLIFSQVFIAIFAYPDPEWCTGTCATNCVNDFNNCVATCKGDFYCNMMTCLKPRTAPVNNCFWPLMIYSGLSSGNLWTDVPLGPSACTGNCATTCVNYFNACVATCNGDFYCNFMKCMKYYTQGTHQCFWPILIFTGFSNPSVS